MPWQQPEPHTEDIDAPVIIDDDDDDSTDFCGNLHDSWGRLDGDPDQDRSE